MNKAGVVRLVAEFAAIVGRSHVLTGTRATRHYRKGYRYGDGPVVAVVRPARLVEMWRVLKICVRQRVIIICQAANTGLTGGSTPDGDDYDRPIVIVNTLRIDRIKLLDGGQQVIALAGATLDQLERVLHPVGREPHSVIGSSCIGASVTGGVCNNSGGSLIRRGPAFTQLSLFARVGEDGELMLVNHLGVELGDDPEALLARLDSGAYGQADIRYDERWASSHDYHTHVRDIAATSPARFNADPRRLFEASGSAGRIAVFAVRLDTFAADAGAKVFYIGTNDAAEFARLRRAVLADFKSLPISGEYLHRDAYDLARRYGKDLFYFIRQFGTQRVPWAFAAKSWADGLLEQLGLGTAALADQVLQGIGATLPEHLPARMNDFAQRYAHHLILKVANEGVVEAREHLAGVFPSGTGAYFECSDAEADAALLHRFVVGGAIVRFRALNRRTIEDVVALDVALPRNTEDWFETLPAELSDKIAIKSYCGHFFCHVMHQEYLVRKGESCDEVEAELLVRLDARGAEYPAEHNVGHRYRAKPHLAQFYRDLDPTNTFNPGIGRTPRARWWGEGTASGRVEPLAGAASDDPSPVGTPHQQHRV